MSIDAEPHGESTEFHRAVSDIVMHYIDAAKDEQHLAVLAKGQAVAARTARNLLRRSSLLGRSFHDYTKPEVVEMVMEADREDETQPGA